MATLGEQSVGSIVKLNVNGVATNFIVVHQGLPGTMYDSSCDGTWVCMENLYTTLAWSSSDVSYAESTAHSYLNNTFFNLLDSKFRESIKTVKIPFYNGIENTGSVVSGANGLSTRIFLPAAREIDNASVSYKPQDGYPLDHFAKYATWYGYLNGTITAWWTRTTYSRKSYTNKWRIGTNGKMGYATYSSVIGIRPMMVLPYNMIVTDSGFVDGTMTSAGAITGSVNIGGVQRELTGEGYINIGGVLRDLSDSQVNIGGILKSLKG